MSQSFDVKHSLNPRERSVIRARAKLAGVSMHEYIRRVVRADANNELVEFIPHDELKAFIHKIDFGND